MKSTNMKKKIAIYGHKARGKEVLELSSNLHNLPVRDHFEGTFTDYVYGPSRYSGYIVTDDPVVMEERGYKVMTLEEYEENYKGNTLYEIY